MILLFTFYGCRNIMFPKRLYQWHSFISRQQHWSNPRSTVQSSDLHVEVNSKPNSAFRRAGKWFPFRINFLKFSMKVNQLFLEKIGETRMHSSRMRTVRCSNHPGGRGVSAWEGVSATPLWTESQTPVKTLPWAVKIGRAPFIWVGRPLSEQKSWIYL